ncbi:MAG: AraC family transcriptional regulator [Lentisphaeria bacterium]|jgi:AraC-like DNA-binding protein
MNHERSAHAPDCPRLPGEVPALFPAKADQARLGWLRPYVREAVHTFRPTWTMGPRRLLDYLILHIREGEVRLRLEEREWQAGPGDLLWIPPGQIHTLAGAAPGTRMLYLHADLIYDPKRSHWAAMFPPGTLDLTPWRRLRHPPLPDAELAAWGGVLALPPGRAATAGRLLEQAVADFGLHGCCTLRGSALLLECIAVLAAPATAVPGPRQSVRMDQAITRLRQRLGGCDLAALARELGFSPSHFRRLFRRSFGQAPRQLLAAEKMKRACHLLAYTDQPVKAIAAALGFTAVQNFARAFRAHTGASPAAFRRAPGR